MEPEKEKLYFDSLGQCQDINIKVLASSSAGTAPDQPS